MEFSVGGVSISMGGGARLVVGRIGTGGISIGISAVKVGK